jgi:hypothetical protein
VEVGLLAPRIQLTRQIVYELIARPAARADRIQHRKPSIDQSQVAKSSRVGRSHSRCLDSFVAQIKTGARIWVPMPKALRDYLETWPRRGDHIVMSTKTPGQPWRETSLTNEIIRVTRDLGFSTTDSKGEPRFLFAAWLAASVRRRVGARRRLRSADRRGARALDA